MWTRRGVVVLAVVAAVGMWGAMVMAADAPAKTKTELKLDTPDAALKSYLACWNNSDYAGIMAASKITDPKKKDVVERYVSFMMWDAALERACVSKFGADEGMKVVGHARTLDKQYEIDQKRVISANVEIDPVDRSHARVFLRVEKDRPEALKVDELTFRDDYCLVKDGDAWKIDFLKTYKLDDAEREEEIKFNAFQAYPVVTKRLKELTEEVKNGKYKVADDVKSERDNAWDKVPGAPEKQ